MTSTFGIPTDSVRPLRYVSVCAGIEAASVAWHPLGWKSVLFSEIDKFPRAVLAHHYPDVPLHGDFTTLIDAPPEADLLVGGTPCQAFSVAGKRLSLDDYRGNLSLAFAGLAHAIDPLRGGVEWVLWENVPGVLSTRDNAFGCLLGRLVGADTPLVPGYGGGWTRAGVVSGPKRTAAWRVLDAQYFGVAQRRERVFVLSSRGPRNWSCAAALFPVGEGLSRYPAPRHETREETSPTAPMGTRSGSVIAPDISPALTARDYKSVKPEAGGACVVVTPTVVVETGIAKWRIGSKPTLRVSMRGNEALVVGDSTATRYGPRRLTPVECERLQGFPDNYTLVPARQAKHKKTCAMTDGDALDPKSLAGEVEVVGPEVDILSCCGAKVREKMAADGPRYKALGNSMAVPVVGWLGRRIQLVRGLVLSGAFGSLKESAR